jgi:Ca2+-transporting ATPase
MHRPPNDPGTPILTGPLKWRIGLVSAMLLMGAFGLFEWELSNGASLAEARTVAVNVFIMGELFYLFNCRSLTKSMFALGVFSNLWVIGGVGTMLALQMLFTYLPAMNYLFHSAPIGLRSWGLILAVSITMYAVIGLEKWLRR